MKWLEGMRDLYKKGPCPWFKGRAEEKKRSCALLYFRIGYRSVFVDRMAFSNAWSIQVSTRTKACSLLLNKQNKVHPIPMKIPIDIPMSRPLIAHPVGSALLEVDYLQYTRIDIVFSLQLAFGLWGSFNPAARAATPGLLPDINCLIQLKSSTFSR